MENINYIASKGYFFWLQIILKERFGCDILLSLQSFGVLKLSLPDGNGTIYFDTLLPGFFTVDSDISCTEWNAENEGFTSVLGRPLPAPGMEYLSSPLIEKNNEGYAIHYDILGLVYWMLSRQEEVGRTDLDNHGRFPATSSHAYKYDYLDRPVVDEWLDILGQVIIRQWPQIQLKQHHSKVLVSCDVDYPYLSYSKSLKSTVRIMLVDMIKRNSLRLALNKFYRYIKVLNGCYKSDPFMNAINWMMDVNEKAGNKMAFYFIPENYHPTYDGCYSMEESVIRRLLQSIHARGHEIGLHTSYTTYQNDGQTRREAEILRQAMKDVGINQREIGGRQHYLRWETPTTARNWDNAGMTYDSTLSYADQPGFRCGTCHEFPMFDPVYGKALSLRQRPLILMECSVISKVYMGLEYTEEAMEYMQELKQRCFQVGGNFTLLWHNSHLNSDKDKEFYRALIS